VIVALVVAVTTLGTPAARADDGTVLLQLLREGSSFRVRARAALALGRVSIPEERVIGALEAALRDPHLAVRAAAARSLGEVGTRRSVAPLRAAAADSAGLVSDQAKNALRMIATREVPRGAAAPPAATPTARPKRSLARARYVVVLGDMRNRTAVPGLELTVLLGERIAEELNALAHVAVLAPAEISDSVARELRRRKLQSFRIEGNLDCVDGGVRAGEHTMRCQVSLLLMDEPGRTLRSLMRGSASGTEQARGARDEQLRVLAGKTLRGAVHSAMATTLQAIEAATIRRHVGLQESPAAAALGH
jgi:hypothetical protein